MLKLLRRVFWGLLVLISLPIVLLIGLFVVLQFQPVRDQVVTMANQFASGPDFALKLEGFRGAPPFDLRLDELSVSDSEGVWLTVDDFSLQIAWRKFVDLRAEIANL